MDTIAFRIVAANGDFRVERDAAVSWTFATRSSALAYAISLARQLARTGYGTSVSVTSATSSRPDGIELHFGARANEAA
jgi:hypothetical protein